MLAARLAERIERRIRALGLPLAVTLWDGRSAVPAVAPRVRLHVLAPKVLATLANGGMGLLARHYVEQELEVEGEARDVVRMAEALSTTSPTAASRRSPMRKWFEHTRLFDRKAVRFHYDAGDDFFALWLDRRRVYSCAYYRRADDSLDLAQEQKLDHICRKLQLKPGERLLDIGCGWGALIQWAAERYRVRALGVTLSQNQFEHARCSIRDSGLGDRCEVRLLDYRDVPEDEPYDKIASVGMFEHVGRKNLPIYFGKIHRLLKPGGLVMNHGITLNSPKLRELGSGIGEFVDEYVFPGGELVHISQVIEEMSAQGIECHDIESLRPHYAKTLWHWCDRLEANAGSARSGAGEKLYRVWRIYLAGSAHAFERGWMSVYQVLAGRPTADGALTVPITRDYMYES